MKWIILPYSESYFEERKYILVKCYQFSCIQETVKRISFENAYESSVIFQPFLYANVPAESPYSVPTFFIICSCLTFSFQLLVYCTNGECAMLSTGLTNFQPSPLQSFNMFECFCV